MRIVLRSLLLIFLGYLVQVCIMPYLAIGGIKANLLFSLIAIVTVAYSKFYTFGIAAVSGILVDAMTSGLPILNLIAYPAIGQLGSLIFADKSERRLEQERSQGKPGTNTNPYIRTLLCALFNITWYEAVHILFIYLNGVSLGWTQFGRMLVSIIYTVAVTAILMLPVRYVLGMYARRMKTQATG